MLLLAYTGARREEVCGLHIEDVHGRGVIPFIDLRENATRGLKNAQSARRLPLHPELVRLGFLDYVEAVGTLGYTLVFPHLRSPSSSALLGDRLYDELAPGLRVVVSDFSERGLTIHSFRHALGSQLKKARVPRELRADILGHGGTTETDERYCEGSDLDVLLEALNKLPMVTAHLTPQLIRLMPWIAQRKPPPFARGSKKVQGRPRVAPPIER